MSGVEAARKSSSKKKSSSKDVKKKPKRSSSSKEAPAPSGSSAPSAGAAAVPPPPTAPVIDPDAIQLFRRYDRARVGRLSRQDFLELLREYAQSDEHHNSAGDPRDRQRQPRRMPLALTDAPGIPLGFARTEKNSEFEAGQLFERYDNDHTGTLTLDKFHVFFADFKPQLSAFVDDLQYAVAVAPRHSVPESPTVVTSAASPAMTSPQFSQSHVSETKSEPKPKEEPKSVRSEYQATLWKLRQICKTELVQQRDRLLELMQEIRDEMSDHQQARPKVREKGSKSRTAESSDWRFLESSAGFPWRLDDNRRKLRIAKYEELEGDLEQIEELLQWVRGHLARGSNISESAMKEFVAQAGEMQAHAQALAMKEFPSSERSKTRDNQPREKLKTTKRQSSRNSDSSEDEPASDQEQTKRDQRSRETKSRNRESELERLVAVKDQMIYQLLHERSSLRKEKASVESSLQQLSDVSTQEMKKWARLTDDMQSEIEHLRGQLRQQQQLSSPMY